MSDYQPPVFQPNPLPSTDFRNDGYGTYGRFLQEVSLLEFRPQLNGIFDDAIAFNNAIYFLWANYGGGRLIVPNVGTSFWLKSTVFMYPNIKILGFGYPPISLQPSANCAAFATLYFSTLNAGSISGVPAEFQNGSYDIMLQGLLIDGQSSTQQIVDFDNQALVCLFGRNITVRDMYIQNGASHGLLTNFQSNNTTALGYISAYEPSFQHIRITNCGGHGFWDQGLHDKHCYDIVVQSCSQAGDNLYDGFIMNKGGRYSKLHAWSQGVKNATGPIMRYGFHCEQSSQNMVSTCQFESVHQSIMINGNQNMFNEIQMYNNNGNNFSAQPGKSFVTIALSSQANDNILTGCWFQNFEVGNSSPQAMYCLQIGDSTLGAAGFNSIENCIGTGFSLAGLVNFENSGGFNNIQMIGNSSSATLPLLYSGTPDPNDTLNLVNRGTQANTTATLFQRYTANTNYSTQVLASGSVYTPGQDEALTVFNHTTLLSALTVDLPSTPLQDGQTYTMSAPQAGITALGIRWNNSTSTVFGNPGTLAAGNALTFKYVANLLGTGDGGWIRTA